MADFSIIPTITTTLPVTADSSKLSISTTLTQAHDVAFNHKPSSWLDLLTWCIICLWHLASSSIYFAIRLGTITIPTFLLSVLSTSWTVTMNATTLYVCSYLHESHVANPLYHMSFIVW